MGRALRRTVGGLLAAALTVSALGFYLYSPRWSLTTDGGPARSAEPAPDQPTATTDPTPTPTPTSPPTVPADNAEPTSGSGLRESGIGLQVRVGRDGTFLVTETVRLAAPAGRLTLAPPDLRPAGNGLAGLEPVVTGLTLRAGDRAVRLPRETMRRPMTVRLPAGTERVVLRYRLRGATKVSRPVRVPGRALGGLGPLVTGVSADLPVTVAFRSLAIRNLGCPSLPLEGQPCFAGQRPDVRVNTRLARKDALVVVQLDLLSAEDRLP